MVRPSPDGEERERVSEPQSPEQPPEQPVEKLVFPDKKDFKFTAAYEAYARAFDASDNQVRKELNDALTKLRDGRMDYSLFYSTINQHIQGADRGSSFRRARIEGQRKQEYAKDERKRGRNERYRG